MATLDQSNTTTTGAILLRRSDAADNNFIAQSFISGIRGTINSISVSLKKDGTPTGHMTLKLFADSGGTNPTGSALSTSTTSLDVSTVSTSQTEYTFNFSDDYTLVPGIKYWYRYEADYTTSLVNTIEIFQNTVGDVYTSGNINRSSDGSTWNNDQGTNDAYFKIFVTPIVTVSNGYSFFM